MGALKNNTAQETAIHTIHGPLIVVSCPGSGKTTTLVRRIHQMIEEGIEPSSILMVTFANAAARDMGEKYVKMYGSNPGITFATIHSLCFNILIRDGGYTKDSIVTEREKQDYFFMRLKNMPNVSDPWNLTRDMITEMSKMKNTCACLAEYEPSCCEKKTFDWLVAQYDEENREAGKLDFDDMLIRCRDLFRSQPEVLSKWRSTFRYIQCDEYQDTNSVQRDILYMLAGDSANLCVVGDDDQAIYGFRGSDSSIMMRFAEDFQSHGAKTVMMSTNYRCAGNIVDLADACITHNKKRFPKDFISERGNSGEKGSALYKITKTGNGQMQDIVSAIRRLHDSGTEYRDMAILFRNNKQAVLPVQALSAQDIPFYSTERIRSIYDEWMFEDIRSYAELSMGRDVQKNMARVLNRPNRFLKTSAFRDASYDTQGMLSSIDYLKADGVPEWRYVQAQKSIFDWMNAFGPGRITPGTPTSVLFSKLTSKTGSIHYDKYITQTARFMRQDPAELHDQFELLKEDAIAYGTVGKWFAHAAQVSHLMRQENEKRDRNGVCITTMHKSKGREWKAVFVIGVNEGTIPARECVTPDEIEEERRLLYVAMTRAKDYLCVYSSGAPSRLMTQTMEALKEKKAPKVPKKLAGAPVKHHTYGPGKILSYSGKYVNVSFEDGSTHKFGFPDAFRNGHLEYV